MLQFLNVFAYGMGLERGLMLWEAKWLKQLLATNCGLPFTLQELTEPEQAHGTLPYSGRV